MPELACIKRKDELSYDYSVGPRRWESTSYGKKRNVDEQAKGKGSTRAFRCSAALLISSLVLICSFSVGILFYTFADGLAVPIREGFSIKPTSPPVNLLVAPDPTTTKEPIITTKSSDNMLPTH